MLNLESPNSCLQGLIYINLEINGFPTLFPKNTLGLVCVSSIMKRRAKQPMGLKFIKDLGR